MSYNPIGQLNNALAAASMPWRVKYGDIIDRNLVNDSIPNGFRFYGDNAAGSGRIHYLVGVDTNNQTSLTNNNGINCWAFTVKQMATPGTPTITTAGTAGSTSYSYKIVAFNGLGASLGSTPASAAGSTSTGNATLTTANYNIVTFPAVSGAAFYEVYRTASSGTPSTTGVIATVQATVLVNTGLPPTTYVVNDTALVGDGTTAPTVNTSGAASIPTLTGGGVQVPTVGTPQNVAVTVNGTAGSTTITYKVTAVAAIGTSAASSAATTTTANATLSTTNSNTITWDAEPGAASYNIYRTAAGGTPSSTGLIGSVNASSALTFTDTGIAGDSTTPPTTNTTGVVSGAILNASSAIISAQSTNYIASETGAANGLVVVLNDAFGVAVPLAAGLRLVIKLGHTLQAGANTVSFNAVVKNLKSHFNVANNLGTVYAATGILDCLYDGTQFVDMSQ